MSGFADFGLSQGVLDAITALEYTEPTPIQTEAIPVIVRGRDIIGQAQTGSGKTAAFGLPAVEQIDEKSEDIQVLVLTPTRELCIQVAQAMRTFSEFKGVRVVACFGGQPIPEQTVQLRQGPQIVVGTPGRVMDLIRRGWLQLSDTRYVVLDEADEMLSLGFMEDVEWILKKTPSGRQTLLFSATMPAPIRKLADRYLYEPVHVKVESATLTVETIDQVIVEVEPNRKLDVLCAVLERDRPAAAIVFRRRKMTVDELVAQLGARGIDAAPLHGDMPQGRRDGVMLRFRSGRAKLLVATNVAARGLDISHISHIFSYDVPDDPEDYTHRIGRTGRVGRNGIAYTFMTNRDRKGVAEIERVTGAKVRHFTADQVIRGEELKVLPPETVAAVTEAAARAPDVEVAVPGRVVESKPSEHGPINGDLAAIAAEATNGAAANGAVAGNGSAANGVPSGEPVTRLFVNAGKRHGVTREALAEAFTASGIEPQRVRMHHTYGLVDVPQERADEAVAALTGSELAGRTLNVELAREQPAAA
jgi:ATP-dependent RNA helicase DeaD